MKPVVSPLLSGFPEIAWPIVGQAIVSDQGQAWCFESILGDRISSVKDQNPAILSLPEDTLFAWCRAHPDRAPAFVAATVPILTTYRIDAPERSLHPVVIRLFNEFGDRDNMLQAITCNMENFGWSGPLVNCYELYREPLRTLHDHPKWQVRRWAKTMLRHLDARIKHACKRDEEWEAQWEI